MWRFAIFMVNPSLFFLGYFLFTYLMKFYYNFADFLILFFTEALFYCGVAIFLLIIDRMRRSIAFDSVNAHRRVSPQFGQRISSVATLVLSLIIPMVTMGFVWPWTGPAASAALAPYLVGIVVQFAFEQYARFKKSPSLAVIPVIFQVRKVKIYLSCYSVTASHFPPPTPLFGLRPTNGALS